MSLWFVMAYLDEDDEIISTEMRGRFEDSADRDQAVEEAREDDPNARVVIIPIDLEGDEEATLEVGEL